MNLVSGNYSAVLGGQSNKALAEHSLSMGGVGNVASGQYSAVAGGRDNCAGGVASWAGGRMAKVRSSNSAAAAGLCGQTADVNGDEGTFSWGGSISTSFISTGPEQFLVRANGGAVFQRQLGSDTFAQSPRTIFNVVSSKSGLPANASGFGTSVASFETDSSTFLHLLTGVGATNSSGLIFGTGSQAVRGRIAYTSSTDTLSLGSATGSIEVRANGVLRLGSLGSAGGLALCQNTSTAEISTCSSSKRYKHDIGDLALGLDAVLALRPVDYLWNDSNLADVGFVAEEVAEIDERLITRNKDGQIEGVKYDRLTAILAGAVQQLSVELDQQKETNRLLESRLAAIEAQLAK